MIVNNNRYQTDYNLVLVGRYMQIISHILMYPRYTYVLYIYIYISRAISELFVNNTQTISDVPGGELARRESDGQKERDIIYIIYKSFFSSLQLFWVLCHIWRVLSGEPYEVKHFFLYVWVCVYTSARAWLCVHVRVCVCLYVRERESVCLNGWMSAFGRVCVHVPLFWVCVSECVCAPVGVGVNVCACMYACMLAYRLRPNDLKE